MVRVKSVELDTATKQAYVFLEADTKNEVTTNPSDVVGMPEGYTFAPFSKVLTADKKLGIFSSSGTWNW